MPRAFPMRFTVLSCFGLSGVLLLGSCQFPRATDGGFDSPNPAARMYAVEQAVRAREYGAVRNIIEQLDSDDPALRHMAIQGLYRLTGQTYGYRHYDPPHEREQAIQRWVGAYEAGELDPREEGDTASDDSREMQEEDAHRG